MKGLVKGIEEALVAIAFSEVGEHAVAREFLSVSSSILTKKVSENHLRSHIPLVPEGDP